MNKTLKEAYNYIGQTRRNTVTNIEGTCFQIIGKWSIDSKGNEKYFCTGVIVKSGEATHEFSTEYWESLQLIKSEKPRWETISSPRSCLNVKVCNLTKEEKKRLTVGSYKDLPKKKSFWRVLWP